MPPPSYFPQKISLHHFFHRGSEQIGIAFAYDIKLIQWIKKLKGTRWSSSNKTWYIQKSQESLSALRHHASLHDLFIDEYQFSAASQKFSVQKKTSRRSHPPKTQASKQVKEFSPEIIRKIEDYRKHLQQLRYAQSTVKTYVSMVRQFFKETNYDKVSAIELKNIREYNYAAFIEKKKSYSTQNQFINAIKLFMHIHGGPHINLEEIERPNKSNNLPNVLTKHEVSNMLKKIKNVKHRTLLSIVYACGLRIGEALSMKLSDLRFGENLIYIKNAKGRKDRRVPLSNGIARQIQKYIEVYQPKEYVFEGQKGGQYSYKSAQSILKRAAKLAGISSVVTLHTLRHSYATHLLQGGTDLRYIQVILGHNSPKTTMLYTHVAANDIRNIKSPFDDMNI